MAQPTGLSYGLAVVMVAVCGYCVTRLVAARRWARPIHFDVNVAHVAMGLAMAGMLVPSLDTLPRGVWEGVFVALALWFTWQSTRALRLHGGAHPLSHFVVHLVMALAMLYMYLAPPSSTGPGAATAMRPPTGTGADFVALPLLFVVVLLASAVWQLDAISKYVAPERAVATVGALERGGGSSALETAQRAETVPAPRWLAPRLEMGCHIAACVTMAYVLVLVL